MGLSNEGREIMDAARSAFGPSESDRARVRDALAVRIATAAVTSASVSWWSSIASALGSKAGILSVVACLAIGSVGSSYVWRRNSAPRAPLVSTEGGSTALRSLDRSRSDLAAAPVDPPSAAPTLPVAEAPNPLPLAGTSHVSKMKVPTIPEHGPDVEGEIALLSEAQKALSGGQPERALQFLDEHARTFPRGTLAEERVAARIIALCKLGRVAKARSEAAAFLQKLPDSPLAERVRVACGDSVTREPAVP